MKHLKPIGVATMTMTIFAALAATAAERTMNLSGDWAFQLDEEKVGVRERWFGKDLENEIRLPGSTDEAGFGAKSQPDPVRLTREYRYVGPAWYQKTIDVPEAWKGKHVELFLERAMWQTQVWLDDDYIGMQDSLCTPHRFDLSDHITPGRRRLTLRIDNRLMINVGHEPYGAELGGWSRMWAMCLTEESQTNWNGAIGRLELRVSDPVWIERVEAHPDLENNVTRITAWIRSRVGAVSGELKVAASCDGHGTETVCAPFRTKGDNERSAQDPLTPMLGDLGGDYYDRRARTRVDVSLPFDDDAILWDEFSPNVYDLKVCLTGTDADGRAYSDAYQDTFGLRTFRAAGNRFTLNGRTVFLRGNQDNCIHPKTAYPPMDRKSWLAFLQKHKDYGLNCMRFHSWCPPEAAFEAADALGMFVHVEMPLWDGGGGVGRLPERAAFIRHESERILDAYGNHPSFCMMSPGNELGSGNELFLQHLVEVWRARDGRHLYTATSHPADPGRNDDFFVSAGGIGGPARGLEHKNGETAFDYEDAVAGYERPFISHEIGQYTSFPDFSSWFNEGKYSGPLKAHYIGMLRNKFEAYHPAERGPKFASASGALQVLFYKTEIEAMLRTPSMDGFHLNGLMDYPGEGIALIGMLDAMGDSKGILTPEEFRRFCSETVALAQITEDELTGGCLFEADAMVRHHGPEDIADSLWLWSISDRSGKVLFAGRLGRHLVPTGGLTELGRIEASLPDVAEAAEMILTVEMADSRVRNAWSFWVFPAEETVAIPEGVTVADAWTGQVREDLVNGGNVFLTLDASCLVDPVPCRFWTVFWGRGLFPNIPRPMGIYCDPAHPALAAFPTRGHSQFQWYSLLTDSAAMNLNNLPPDFEPVAYMIDDFNECARLGLVLEAKVGKGRLVATTLNLGTPDNRTPAQKQMLRSLLAHAGDGDSAAARPLSVEELSNVFREPEMTLWQKEQAGAEPAPGAPLFAEDFHGLQSPDSARQEGTGQELKAFATLRGWKATGLHAIHAVQRTDKTWAAMLLAGDTGRDNNILTLNNGFDANEAGRRYTVRFEAGPTNYQTAGQGTLDGDRFQIELLRRDGSVLARQTVECTAWASKEDFTQRTFAYTGDGSGGLRIRVSPVPDSEIRVSPLPAGEVRFVGAISHLRIVPEQYPDGRPAPTFRMEAEDYGVVLRHGDGPGQCDVLGARDVWVFEADGLYCMHYDAAGPRGWLCSLAVSRDLLNWEKQGPVLDFGQPGEDDAKSASYGVTYFNGKDWHMFYLGTPNTSPSPNLVPAFPYLTMKAKAVSPTGPWTKQKDVVPFRPEPDTYYSLTASPGHIVKHGDEYLQFFSATTRKPDSPYVQRTLGVARTRDLDGPWTVDPKPMVPIEEQIENSSVYCEESSGTWFLFTNHIGLDGGEYTDAVWVYWSRNLNEWDPANKAVVLDGANCTWSSRCIGLPSVVRVKNRLALFYDAPGGDSTSHMRRDVGLAWLDLPLVAPGSAANAKASGAPSALSRAAN